MGEEIRAGMELELVPNKIPNINLPNTPYLVGKCMKAEMIPNVIRPKFCSGQEGCQLMDYLKFYILKFYFSPKDDAIDGKCRPKSSNWLTPLPTNSFYSMDESNPTWRLLKGPALISSNLYCSELMYSFMLN